MQDREIDLLLFIKIIWKRKLLVLAVTGICLALGVVLAFTLPPVYEASMIIEPGKIMPWDDKGSELVENPVTIKEAILNGTFDDGLKKDFKLEKSEQLQLFVSLFDKSDALRIALWRKNRRQAEKMLQGLLLKLKHHLKTALEERGRLDYMIDILGIKRQSSREEEKILRGQIQETRKVIAALEADRRKALAANPNDSMSILLYLNELKTNRAYLDSLQVKLEKVRSTTMKQEVIIRNCELTKRGANVLLVHKPPAASEQPVSPKKVLLVLVSLVLGFFGSLVMVFLLEFIRNETA